MGYASLGAVGAPINGALRGMGAFGASTSQQWFQIWSPGNRWAGWMWADHASAVRVANAFSGMVATASGQRVGAPALCSELIQDQDGHWVMRPGCF